MVSYKKIKAYMSEKDERVYGIKVISFANTN